MLPLLGMTGSDKHTRTVVGLFKDPDEAMAALHDLERHGIPHDDISVVRPAEQRETAAPDENEFRSGTAKGAALGGVAGALLGMAAMAVPGLGPVIALGPIAAALTGAGVGAATGGMLGALSDMGIPERDVALLQESVRRGGTIVAVHSGEAGIEDAKSVLDRHGALDVHEEAREWSESGWTLEDAHADAPNFGDEGGSSQWGRSVLSAGDEGKPSRSRVYERLSPDNRKG